MRKNHFQSLDAAFLNSAYLSELWAVQDLIRIKKKFSSQWTDGKEKQLNDETRHARLLLNLLHETGSAVVYSLKYSMQERLYRPYLDLSTASTLSESSIVHNMTESRALWIYKTYLKIRPESSFKNTIESIIEDEKGHFECNDFLIEESDLFLKKTLQAVDKLIFREVLPNTYGRLVYQNLQFWENYYKDCVFEKNYEKIETAQIKKSLIL